MYLEKIENKQKFENNGFVILDTNLNSNEIFINTVEKIYKELDHLILKREFKNYGGYMMGNFGINQGLLGKKLYSLLFQKDFISLFESLIENKIDNYSVNYGGNLTLPKKGLQHFHMDGDFKKEMYLVSIATENIDLMNGPTEICAGSHKKDLSFWKFFFSKKNKLKLKLNKGQVLIRRHNLWHRGTKNNSDRYRLLLSFVFIPITKKNQVVPISKNLEILPNFFKSNISGRIQEFLYVRLRIFHVFFKLVYSFLLKK